MTKSSNAKSPNAENQTIQQLEREVDYYKERYERTLYDVAKLEAAITQYRRVIEVLVDAVCPKVN